jgi:uncharacterized protein YkwD
MFDPKAPLWFYLTNAYGHDALRGPVSFEEIVLQISEGTITGDTQVRLGENALWKTASSSDTLKPYIDNQQRQINSLQRQEKIKRNAPLLILILIIGTALSLLDLPSSRNPEKIREQRSESTIIPINNPILPAPGPTINPSAATNKGIVEATNIIRQNHGLPPLTENPLLNQIANERLEDMFKYQYFSHESPSGEKHSTIAQRIGYHYKRLAENIASISNSPNSPTDKEFLDGWMQSPGHRSAILDNEVKEIGVAVRKGYFKYGETTMGVQIFGLESPPIGNINSEAK